MVSFNNNEGSFTPDSLVMGCYRAKKVIFKSGAGVLKRGAVVGRVSADGSYKLALAASNDGSQDPDAVLSADIDATSADVQAVVFYEGTFDQTVLTLGAGITLGSLAQSWRTKNLYLENPMV